MHLAALAFGLALSLVERRVNSVVANKWSPFLNVYKSIKNIAKYVCDKKNKRYPKYQKALAGIFQDVFMIKLPNDTRVAGALLLIQDALRSLFALRYFATVNEGLDKMMIKPEQWRQLAQFEAIMRPGMKLCFDVQGDRPEIAGETVLALAILKSDFAEENIYKVVDVDAAGWSADTPFNSLPMVEMTNDPNVSTLKNIP